MTFMPVQGAGNLMWRGQVDGDGNSRLGATQDRQARLDARTGQFDHWSSAKANGREAAVDGLSAVLGIIPLAGGIPNFVRGLGKVAWGAVTGKSYLVNEGVRNLGKGVLYSIPGVGPLAAGANFAKNSFDTVAHAGFALTDKVRYGGNAGKQGYALHLMQGNMGYGAGIASRYPQVASPGYW